MTKTCCDRVRPDARTIVTVKWTPELKRIWMGFEKLTEGMSKSVTQRIEIHIDAP